MKLSGVAMAFVVAALAPAASADDTGPSAVIDGSPVETRFHRGLPWRPLRRSGELRYGEQLRCREACRVRFSDATEIALAPDAVVVAAPPIFRRFEADHPAVRC